VGSNGDESGGYTEQYNPMQPSVGYQRPPGRARGGMNRGYNNSPNKIPPWRGGSGGNMGRGGGVATGANRGFSPMMRGSPRARGFRGRGRGRGQF